MDGDREFFPGIIESSSDLANSHGMNRPYENRHIGDLLIENGLVTNDQVSQARNEQQTHPNLKLGRILVDLGYVSEEDMLIGLSRKLGLPFARLAQFDIDPSVVEALPAEIARRYHVMPLLVLESRLFLATEDPTNIETVKMLRFMANYKLEFVLATKADINNALSKYYGALDERDALEKLEVIEEVMGDINDDEPLDQLGRKKPIVRFVNNIIKDAIEQRASDIHIKPRDRHVDLVYRIDGSLVQVRTFSKSLLPSVTVRFKIIGGMDITERRVPQDGRTKMVIGKRVVDLRLSILPTVRGESINVRLLDKQVGLRGVEEIGFSDFDLKRFRHMISRPNGMVLVTGPTGSGKSSTLYAAIQEIRRKNVHIITVEDPVEYEIDGITQIQVNNVTGYTFARALRHILRHDPDVIMLGEIRDQETAKIAVESALTGHVVFSTLHTNSAAAAITRLIEIGVEPYLINTALVGVLAQRLVKKNCEHCMVKEVVDEDYAKLLKCEPGETFYRGEGCDHCNGTGYYGRLAVYELLEITPTIRAMINDGANLTTIEKAAMEEGTQKLTQQALEQARKKRTSLDEVYRIRLE